MLICCAKLGGRVPSQSTEITQLLHLWRTGDYEAEAKLFELVLPELRTLAARYLRRERNGHTLQPTALVNEAFLRLAAAKDIDWHDRGHFLALAARIMRRHLIDHARSRPDVRFLALEGLPEYVLSNHTKLELVVAVDELLDELGKEYPQRRAVVELKFFLGLTDTEAAGALGLSLHTFQREWYRARRWLFERLSTKKWNAVPNAISA
jgi:RNA polymerase sigma factor (TIGR02999 family)